MAKALPAEKIRLGVQLSKHDLETMISGAQYLPQTDEIKAFVERAIRNLAKLEVQIEKRRKVERRNAPMVVSDDLPGTPLEDLISDTPAPLAIVPVEAAPAPEPEPVRVVFSLPSSLTWTKEGEHDVCQTEVVIGDKVRPVILTAGKSNSAWDCNLTCDALEFNVRGESRIKAANRAMETLRDQIQQG